MIKVEEENKEYFNMEPEKGILKYKSVPERKASGEVEEEQPEPDNNSVKSSLKRTLTTKKDIKKLKNEGSSMQSSIKHDESFNNDDVLDLNTSLNSIQRLGSKKKVRIVERHDSSFSSNQGNTKHRLERQNSSFAKFSPVRKDEKGFFKRINTVNRQTEKMHRGIISKDATEFYGQSAYMDNLQTDR